MNSNQTALALKIIFMFNSWSRKENCLIPGRMLCCQRNHAKLAVCFHKSEASFLTAQGSSGDYVMDFIVW